MKDQPFIVRQRANIHSSTPFNQNEDAVEKAKTAGKFIAQETAGQALKKFAGNVASKIFGTAGMLLSSQKAYAGGKSKNDWATEQYLKDNPDAKLVRSVEDLK